MCGIAGFYLLSGFESDWAYSVANTMGIAIAHRGPDDSGEWCDGDAGIAFAHRRLSILDLSNAGHQPMVSPSGRYIIILNGEIYNHLEIRKELPLHAWRGHSDTETIIVAIEKWGVEQTLKKTVGMFAIAVWDRNERQLKLARDRMGEKPLYYGWQGNTFLFGSELKALRRHPAFLNCINQEALPLLIRFGYIPAPYSIYQNIYKLSPGAVLTVSQSSCPEQPLHPTPYWSLLEQINAASHNQFQGTDRDAISELDMHLQNSICLQMTSDVPVGAFLSGGIDSSTVVALMQAQSAVKIKTFSIGFDEQGYNEAHHAKAVATHLGTSHTELYVTSRQAMDIIPNLATIYDEPFGDSSAIPTYLVSQLAKQQVTVSLSGDGGDELFGGYDRYFSTLNRWKQFSKLPAKNSMALVLNSIPDEILDKTLAPIAKFLRGKSLARPLSNRMEYLVKLLKNSDHAQFYQLMISQCHSPEKILINPSQEKNDAQALSSSLLDHMMIKDSLMYLPDDILTKVDRAAMAVSLETRVPLLDYRLIEWAWALPQHLKIRNGEGKWLLKQVLYKYVPKSIMDRPKMGFGVPVDHWLRGPLRDWAEDLLNESQLRSQGYFNHKLIRQCLNEHCEGIYNWKDFLWPILMTQAWLKKG
jgi:asparagine synthase (glutamine-hydrolysing)